jgi:hypothetical protein
MTWCSPTVKADRLKLFFALDRASPALAPVSDVGQPLAVTWCYPVLWWGHMSANDEWLRWRSRHTARGGWRSSKQRPCAAAPHAWTKMRLLLSNPVAYLIQKDQARGINTLFSSRRTCVHSHPSGSAHGSPLVLTGHEPCSSLWRNESFNFPSGVVKLPIDSIEWTS